MNGEDEVAMRIKCCISSHTSYVIRILFEIIQMHQT
jgi:hypothetical protein